MSQEKDLQFFIQNKLDEIARAMRAEEGYSLAFVAVHKTEPEKGIFISSTDGDRVCETIQYLIANQPEERVTPEDRIRNILLHGEQL